MKKWENKIESKLIKLIRSQIGLLFVTLLFVTSFIFACSSKSYAIDLESGHTYKFTISDGIAINYSIQADYNGSTFTNTKTTNDVLIDGKKVTGENMFQVLFNAYALNTNGQNKIKVMVEELLTQLLITSNDDNASLKGGVYHTFSTHSTPGMKYEEMIFLKRKGNKVEWQKYDSNAGGLIVVYPKDVIYFDENGTNNASTILFGDTALWNYADKDCILVLNKILPNSKYISVEEITEDNLDDTSGSKTSGVVAKGETYTAEFEINSVAINIVVKDKSSKEVARFFFADVIGNNEYKEKRYNNSFTSNVKVRYDGKNYELTTKLTDKKLENSKNFYYLIEGENKYTFDKYYDALNSASKEKLLNSTIFVAMPDDSMKNVVIYSSVSAKGQASELTKQLTLSIDSLKDKYKCAGSQILVDGWIFDIYKDSQIVAYKKDTVDLNGDNVYYYNLDLTSLRKAFIKGNKYMDVLVPIKRGTETNYFNGYPETTNQVFCIISNNSNFSNKSTKANEYSIKEIRSEFLGLLNNDTAQLLAVTGMLKTEDGLGAGSHVENKLDPSRIYTRSNQLSTMDLPPSIPLNEMLRMVDDYKEEINKQGMEISTDIGGDIGEEKVDVENAFVSDVLKYGKVILLFLIFLSIIYTGILSIMSSQDANSRALIKTRIKNILIGALIFACIVPIFSFVLKFARDSFTSLGDIASNYVGPTYNATVTRYQTGWLVSLVASVIDIITKLFNWLIDEVLALSMTEGQSRNIMQLIYSVYDSGSDTVSSLLPFTAREWRYFMEAYKLLSSVFICLLAIAGVKVSYELVIYSGNYEKIAECKESMKRAVFAILGMVFAPYIFRLLFLIVNYMVAMLPIDGENATFDINFEAAGFVGSVANFSFATVRLRIYIAFLVRKVMLLIMLMASPVVLGMWVIDKKFRGVTLWIGETFANVIMQFSYAMVFLVVILISYEGQNPFVTLTIVLLIPKLANFFSKSVQGFAQRWGSINSENMANEVVNFMKQKAGKTIGGVKSFGGGLQNLSRYLDKEGITKTGRNVHNLGALMQGNFLGLRTQREMMMNRARSAQKDYREEQQEYNLRQKEVNPFLESDKDIKDYYDNFEEYTRRGGTRTGTGYDQVNAFKEQESRTNLAKQKANGYASMVDNYVMDGQSNLGEFAEKALTGIERHIDDTTPYDEMTRGQKMKHATMAGAYNTVKFLAMGPMSAMQQISSPVSEDVFKKIRTDAANACGDIGNVNVSEIVDSVVKMKNKLETGQGTLDADIDDKTIKSLEKIMRSDETKSLAKLETIKAMLSVAMNYKIAKDESVDYELISRLNEVTKKYNDDARAGTELNYNTDDLFSTKMQKNADRINQRIDEAASENFDRKIGMDDEEQDELVKEARDKELDEFREKLLAHEKAKAQYEEAERRKKQIEEEVSNLDKKESEKIIKAAERLVRSNQIALEEAKKQKDEQFKQLEKQDLDEEFKDQKELERKIKESEQFTRQFKGANITDTNLDHLSYGSVARDAAKNISKANAPKPGTSDSNPKK